MGTEVKDTKTQRWVWLMHYGLQKKLARSMANNTTHLWLYAHLQSIYQPTHIVVGC